MIFRRQVGTSSSIMVCNLYLIPTQEEIDWNVNVVQNEVAFGTFINLVDLLHKFEYMCHLYIL